MSKNKHYKAELLNFIIPKSYKLKVKIKIMKIPTKIGKLTKYANWP